MDACIRVFQIKPIPTVHICIAGNSERLQGLHFNLLNNKEGTLPTVTKEVVSAKFHGTADALHSVAREASSTDSVARASSSADSVACAVSPADSVACAVSSADSVDGAASPPDSVGRAASLAGSVARAASPAEYDFGNDDFVDLSNANEEGDTDEDRGSNERGYDLSTLGLDEFCRRTKSSSDELTAEAVVELLLKSSFKLILPSIKSLADGGGHASVVAGDGRCSQTLITIAFRWFFNQESAALWDNSPTYKINTHGKNYYS